MAWPMQQIEYLLNSGWEYRTKPNTPVNYWRHYNWLGERLIKHEGAHAIMLEGMNKHSTPESVAKFYQNVAKLLDTGFTPISNGADHELRWYPPVHTYVGNAPAWRTDKALEVDVSLIVFSNKPGHPRETVAKRFTEFTFRDRVYETELFRHGLQNHEMPFTIHGGTSLPDVPVAMYEPNTVAGMVDVDIEVPRIYWHRHALGWPTISTEQAESIKPSLEIVGDEDDLLQAFLNHFISEAPARAYCGMAFHLKRTHHDSLV